MAGKKIFNVSELEIKLPSVESLHMIVEDSRETNPYGTLPKGQSLLELQQQDLILHNGGDFDGMQLLEKTSYHSFHQQGGRYH